MAKLTGIPAAPGVAIGRVFTVDRRRARVPRFHIPPEEVESEIARLDAANAKRGTTKVDVAELHREVETIFRVAGI